MLMAGAATVLVAGAAIGQLGLLGAPASAADGGSGGNFQSGPGGPAAHATPTLSGSYAFAMTVICQTGIFTSMDPITHAVNSFVVTNSGNLTQRVGVADFNSSTHQFTFSGTNLNAPQVQQNVPGFGLSQAPETVAIPYSNTATTLTLGDSLPYSVAYANVTGGIAQYFVFAGRDAADSGCTHSGNAMRQTSRGD
jgi:hypothetical protein